MTPSRPGPRSGPAVGIRSQDVVSRLRRHDEPVVMEADPCLPCELGQRGAPLTARLMGCLAHGIVRRAHGRLRATQPSDARCVLWPASLGCWGRRLPLGGLLEPFEEWLRLEPSE